MYATNGCICSHCGEFFNTTFLLGRHVRRMHRRSENHAEPTTNTPTEYDDPTENDWEFYDEVICNGVADDAFDFYEAFQDTASELFADEPELKPPISDLCPRARALLRYCCMKQSTLGDVRQTYDLETSQCSQENTCNCQDEFKKQFPTANLFSSYVCRARKLFVHGQHWRKADIATLYGINSTGVFRPIVPIVTAVIKSAGGYSQILPFKQNVQGGKRVYSSIQDSDALRLYTDTAVAGSRIVCLDFYADGTTLARSGAHSACVVRMRVANVAGYSEKWFEVGIAPVIPNQTSYTESHLAQQRLELHHRFLHLLCRDAIIASKAGIIVDSRLVFFRVGTLVCDQKQERTFLSLKSAGSFMDCSMCVMPSRAQSNIEAVDMEDFLEGQQNISAEQVYALQTNPDNCARRSVVGTVTRQITVATYEKERTANSSNVRNAKKYLHQVSASKLPSAFASFYGLGTEPFLLFESIGLDRLHALDLGIIRDIPDHAYRLFGTPSYNKGLYSRAALVRTANQRYKDLPRAAGINVCPFRGSKGEVHSGMTGHIRRRCVPFLWVAVLGLQPNEIPDEDLLMQAALSVNELQIGIRGINMDERNVARDLCAIENLQRMGFRAGLYLSQALGVPVNTKKHRTMRHIRNHFVQFGSARRGDSDENETLHKLTKSTYNGTNHRLEQLAPQILAIRSVSLVDNLIDQDENETSPHENKFCTQFRRTVLLTPSVSPYQETESHDTHTVNYATSDTTAQRSMINTLAAHMPVTDADAALHSALSIEDSITRKLIWKRISKVSFLARFHWVSTNPASTSNVRQVVYAGDYINGKGARYDAVEYEHNGLVLRGFIHIILEGSAFGTHLVSVVIKRLRKVQTQIGNRKIVDDYGYCRLGYDLNSTANGDVKLDVVTVSSLRRVIIVVRDMYDVVQRFGIEKRMNQIIEDVEERRRARFFEVRGVQNTTLD